MKARVKSTYPQSLVQAFGGHAYIRDEWRHVPVGHDQEAARLDKWGLLDLRHDEVNIEEPILAVDLEELTENELRELAKEKGIKNFWNKKIDTLIAELRED